MEMIEGQAEWISFRFVFFSSFKRFVFSSVSVNAEKCIFIMLYIFVHEHCEHFFLVWCSPSFHPNNIQSLTLRYSDLNSKKWVKTSKEQKEKFYCCRLVHYYYYYLYLHVHPWWMIFFLLSAAISESSSLIKPALQ